MELNRANTSLLFYLFLLFFSFSAVMKSGWKAQSTPLPTSEAGPIFGHKENPLMGQSAGSG